MGKGLYTNTELIESLLSDLNNLLKEQLNGQYIKACIIVNQMSQKILNLREGVEKDMKNKVDIIEQLKTQLRNAGQEVIDLTPEELAKSKPEDFVRIKDEKDGAE